MPISYTSPAEQYRYRRTSGFGFILFGLVLLAPCMGWIFQLVPSTAAVHAVVARSILAALYLTFTLLFLRAGLTFMLERRVVMRLDDTGITDERYSPEPILWAAITAMWEQTGGKSSVAGLGLRFDP